jgi:hypothetical protein
MPVIALLTAISIMSLQLADLAAWWTATLVSVSTALSRIRRVATEPVSTTMILVKGDASTMRRAYVGSECYNWRR